MNTLCEKRACTQTEARELLHSLHKLYNGLGEDEREVIQGALRNLGEELHVNNRKWRRFQPRNSPALASKN